MNQKTAKMILELASTPGGMHEWATLEAREEIRADLAGKPIHPRDCGQWETWKAIHANLDTPLGSDATMKAWALQRIQEIAAQKDSENLVDSPHRVRNNSRIGGNQADDKE